MFSLADEDVPIVAEICARLAGLPLAIELAASRVRLLPPRQLLDRLGPALPMLVGGPRDAPERQRTLEAAIGWSHDLLVVVAAELAAPGVETDADTERRTVGPRACRQALLRRHRRAHRGGVVG